MLDTTIIQRREMISTVRNNLQNTSKGGHMVECLAVIDSNPYPRMRHWPSRDNPSNPRIGMYDPSLREFLVSTPDHQETRSLPPCDNTCVSSNANPRATGSLSEVEEEISTIQCGSEVFNLPRTIKLRCQNNQKIKRWSHGRVPRRQSTTAANQSR